MSDLNEWEQLLSSLSSDVSLLGQIELDRNSVRTLGQLVKEEVSRTTFDRGLGRLRNHYPLSLACVLVWEGVFSYKAGDYWGAVSESLGGLTIGQKVKLGEFLLSFLRRKNLPTFDIHGAHKYVTPILAHGGIPNHCLGDFFKNLLFPVVSGQLDLVSHEAEEIIEEWHSRSSAVYFTDKPVTRFLLRGGAVATSFLSRCIEMAEYAYEGEEIPEASDIDLPQRIVRRFEDWWKNHVPDGPRPSATADRFRRPSIILDPTIAEIRLLVPTQRLKFRNENIFVEIRGDHGYSKRIPLRLYSRGSFFETEETYDPLEHLATEYNVRLLKNETTLREWTYSGITREVRYLLFSSDTMKLSRSKLQDSVFWLVLPKVYSVEPEASHLEVGAEFYGDWKDYVPLLVSTKGIEFLNLTPESGKPIELRAPASILEADLVGGELVDFCHSEGRRIYAGSSPGIQLTNLDEEQAKRIRLRISPLGRSMPSRRVEHRLNDLSDLQTSDGQVHIPLNDKRLLGDSPIGRFRIDLRGRLGQDKRFSICCIPQLSVSFDREVYYPTSSGSSPATLGLTTPPRSSVSITEPSKLVLSISEGRGLVSIPPSYRSLTLVSKIELPNGEICAIPVTVEIPRVRWSIRGLLPESEFRDLIESKEIDMQQWQESQELHLILDAPNVPSNGISLELKGSNHKIPSQLRKGKVRFPLEAFSDTLRESGRAENKFIIKIGPKPKAEFTVLTVYTEWELTDLEWDEKIADQFRSITLAFEEKGQLNNRSVRLKNLWCPWMDDIEERIPDGTQSVIIKRELSSFLPGLYEATFIVEDPWYDNSKPPRHNVHLFKRRVGIGKDDRIPLENMGGRFGITLLFYVDRYYAKHALTKTQYQILVQDYVGRQSGEDLYEGLFSVKAESGSFVSIPRVNPITFYYSSQGHTINGIRDRDNDGAYFCSECKKVFWSHSSYLMEIQKRHKQYLHTDGRFKVEVRNRGDKKGTTF